MGLIGFEPMTSPLSGVRSYQLSYKPAHPGRAVPTGAQSIGEGPRGGSSFGAGRSNRPDSEGSGDDWRFGISDREPACVGVLGARPGISLGSMSAAGLLACAGPVS